MGFSYFDLVWLINLCTCPSEHGIRQIQRWTSWTCSFTHMLDIQVFGYVLFLFHIFLRNSGRRSCSSGRRFVGLEYMTFLLNHLLLKLTSMITALFLFWLWINLRMPTLVLPSFYVHMLIFPISSYRYSSNLPHHQKQQFEEKLVLERSLWQISNTINMIKYIYD